MTNDTGIYIDFGHWHVHLHFTCIYMRALTFALSCTCTCTCILTFTFTFTVALTCALSLSLTLSHRLTLKNTAYVDLNVDADVYMFMYTNIFNHCEEAMCFFNAQCCHTTVHCGACHLTVENVVISCTDPAQSCLRSFLRMCDREARLLSSSPDQTFATRTIVEFQPFEDRTDLW